ncbi:SHOCT domain-containing protein [Mycolicibacter minnesotensis]
MGRIPRLLALILMLVGVIGFVAALILNVFVFDGYNAYGEVPIPGSGGVHLPAGEVTVSLHTRVIGTPSGGGLPVPPLSVGITPPPGVAQPAFAESIGMTTTVNNDSRRRLWRIQVVTPGEYQVTADGQVGGYIAPRLAFGHSAAHWWLVWVFPVVFVLGLLAWIVAGRLASRLRRRGRRRSDAAEPYLPEGDGVRAAELRNLTALRDSGALTESEYRQERRRIQRGY